MQNKMRVSLLATTAFAVALMLGTPAHAADKTSTSKLQEQITALQKQIDALKVAQTAPVAAANAAAPAAPAATGSAADKLQASIQQSTGVKVQVGGFFDVTAAYRTKNEAADVGTSWNGIPYNSSANAHQGEFRASARNTRINLLATGAADKDTTVSGFVEVDFAGTGVNSSENQSNNYTPRFRQGYATYDQNAWGLHVLAGQAWSLATQNSVGITPRKEQLPMVLDAGLVPATVWTRAAQLRIVGDFADKAVTAGVSFEAPATVGASASYGSSTAATGISGTGVVAADGVAPDVIAKVAYDPGFGHYEVFGMGRTFHDRSTAVNGVGGSNNTIFAANGGASVLFKTLSNKLDLSANMIAGQSIGRYMAGQLPDVAYTASGELKPIVGYGAQIGAVGHVTPTFDVYGYAGVEQVLRMDSGATTTASGYGNSALAGNDSCYTEGSTGTACAAQTKRIWQITGGVSKAVYKGDMGKIAVGLQESMTRKDAFSGAGDYAPHATEYTTMFAVRYAPTF